MNDVVARAYKLLTHEMTSWFDLIVTSLPNVFLAMVVVILSFIFSNFIQRVAQTLIAKTHINQMIGSLLLRTVKTTVIIVGFFMVMGILNLQKTVTSLLAGAGVIGLVLGLAFQDFMSNFFASIMIGVRKPFVHGDIIESGETMGTVVDLNLRNTVIRNFDGQQVLVPNKEVIQRSLRNYTRYGTRRISLHISVAYGSDLLLAANCAVAALKSVPEVLAEPPPVVHFSDISWGNVNFDVRLWIAYPNSNYFEVRSAALLAILHAFNEGKVAVAIPLTIAGAVNLEPFPNH